MSFSEEQIVIYMSRLARLIRSSHDTTVLRSRVRACWIERENNTRPASRSRRGSSWGLTIVQSAQSSCLFTSQRCWSALSNKHSKRHSKRHQLPYPRKHLRFSLQRHPRGVGRHQHQHPSLTLGRKVQVPPGQPSNPLPTARIR